MNESEEEIKAMNCEEFGKDNENPIRINGSEESLKVFDDDVSPWEKPIIESKNSPSLMNESVEKIETLNSEDLGKANENLIGINGSDESVKVFDDDVSSREKPIMESKNSPSLMSESVEKIETMNSEEFGKANENPIGTNGSDESVKVFDDEASPKDKTQDDPIVESSNSPSSVGTGKGKGLRKWRRIKREGVKDGTGSADYSKAMKRGLSGSAPNPIRGQKSEGSLSSTGAVVKNFGNEANGFISDTKGVSVGPAESESSISSTAASGSVFRNGELVGVRSEKKEVNGVQGKAQVKSKKARGEREKCEKEDSISISLESDSRSSNFMFVQGADSVANNGMRSGMVENSDDENEDGEKDIVDGVEYGISKANGEEFGDLTGDGNQNSAKELDPLAVCIFELQSAQEALEKEIQNLREMGDESQRTTEENGHEANSSGIFNLRKNAENFPHHIKNHVNTVKENIDVSESKLEETNVILKAKETYVTKLKYEETEDEIEELLKQKLEAEFQCLAISNSVEKFKADLVDQVAFSDELKTMLNVVRDAENNVNVLERRAKKLETRVEETVETEQVPKLQKSVCQVTSFLFIQLILLFLVFVSFILHLSPSDAGVVPT